MSAATTPSDQPVGARWRSERQALLDDQTVTGTGLCRALTAQIEGWFTVCAADLPPGFALAATAGYARRQICPGSDVDVLLLHDRRSNEATVQAVAKGLWYPIWDAGVKLSPGTHTVASALELAVDDQVMATTLLAVRPVAGDDSLVRNLAEEASAQWRRRAARWLDSLAKTQNVRHDRHGEVAFLLEPDLKEGRGGLRDVHTLGWALESGHPAVEGALEQSLADLECEGDVLLAARAELHRATKRPSDKLLLQEQDGVARSLGYADADALMLAVADSARSIAWVSDQFWRRVTTRLQRRPRLRARARIRVGVDLVSEDGEIALDRNAQPDGDPALLLRVAATAAQMATLPTRDTLRRLAAEALGPGEPWTDDARAALLTLLGAGTDALPVWEALDRYGLSSRILPEWAPVRSRPQRNAYHRYTVDRHLWQSAALAAGLVRRVARPDLLLVGAWLHDLGKGYPGDHTAEGVVLIGTIGARMGFNATDVAILRLLVEHHLLLPETATRRDLDDPGTIAMVAKAVGDADTLDLLFALTEADSLATGLTAWSDWKAGLMSQLVRNTKSVLAGRRPLSTSGERSPEQLAMMDAVRGDGRVQLRAGRGLVTVAARDRVGLFSSVAGVLSLHGVDVLSADAWTSDDGIALDEFRVARRLGGETPWRKVETDLAATLAGELDLERKLGDKVKAYASARRPTSAARPPRAEVLIDNDTSADATIVEVRAPDGLAVLHRMTSVLARQGLDIRFAKVATLGHEVVDAFYVRVPTARGPGKLDDPSAVEGVRNALLAELSG